MMKKLFVLLLLFLCLFKTNTVFAENAVVLDDSIGLISENYKQEIREDMQGIADKYNINLVLIVTDNTQEKSIEDFADDYYDDLFFNQDGFTFAVDMSSRQIYASGVGTCIDAISDYEIDYMFDVFKEYASYDDYDNAFVSMIDSFDYYYSYDDSSDIDDYNEPIYRKPTFGVFNVVVSAIIGALFSVVTGIILKRQLKSVAPKVSASNYGSDFVVTGMSDFFVGSHVSKTPIHRDDNRSNGNFSGHTTHISSSGVSHSGHSSHF